MAEETRLARSKNAIHEEGRQCLAFQEHIEAQLAKIIRMIKKLSPRHKSVVFDAKKVTYIDTSCELEEEHYQIYIDTSCGLEEKHYKVQHEGAK